MRAHEEIDNALAAVVKERPARHTAAPHLAAGDLATIPLTRRGPYLEWHTGARAADVKASAARTVARTLAETVATAERVKRRVPWP